MVKIVNMVAVVTSYMAYRSDPSPPLSDQLYSIYHEQKLSESEDIPYDFDI